MQVIFPLDLDLKLPEDDSLRLLIEITEEMDWDESGIQRVSGKGCRKSKLQKDLEKFEEYQNRREQYSRKKKRFMDVRVIQRRITMPLSCG